MVLTTFQIYSWCVKSSNAGNKKPDECIWNCQWDRNPFYLKVYRRKMKPNCINFRRPQLRMTVETTSQSDLLIKNMQGTKYS